jgi:hypothetical protein
MQAQARPPSAPTGGILSAAEAKAHGDKALRAKNARIKAEQDLQMLQNRVNRLIIEEEKAAKRIAETRRRAREICDLKERNASNHTARSEAAQWMNSEQGLQRELLDRTREDRKEAVTASRNAMQKMRCDEVAVLRRIRKENEQALQVSKEMERARCVARKNLVKEQQRKSHERKADQRQAQLQHLRMNREQAREEIDDVTAMQLQQVADLHEEEQRLLKSVEGVQLEQAMAFRDLDTVLGRQVKYQQRPATAG